MDRAVSVEAKPMLNLVRASRLLGVSALELRDWPADLMEAALAYHLHSANIQNAAMQGDEALAARRGAQLGA